MGPDGDLTMPTKLTDRIVKSLPIPASGKRIHYDSEVRGFGVRVYSSGVRAFILRYRTRTGAEKLYTIGSFPTWPTLAARTEAAELKRVVDRGGDPAADDRATREAPTVNDLCDRFEAECLPRNRLTTRTNYLLQLNAEVRPALGKHKVREITFADVDRLHRRIGRRAPTQANRVLALLSKMFSMAIRWQWRSDNPCKGIERNQENKRQRYLSADELARLVTALDACSDQQAADIIRLLLLTGARRGEVLAARWADFDPEFKTWRKPASATKQKLEHSIPLSEPAQVLLAGLRKRAAASCEWVFPGYGGEHRKVIYKTWSKLCRAAQIDGVRLHDLRHTFASVLVSAGHSLPMIGALLGHTMPGTTARYAHLFDDPLRAATEQVGKIITGGNDRH
jgi:integrase